MKHNMIVFAKLKNFYTALQESNSLAAVARNGEVLEATDIADRQGVAPGIPVRLARRRCPGLEVREFQPDKHTRNFESVWSIIAEFTPIVETTDFHQGYLDITKDAQRYGCAEETLEGIANELLARADVKLRWGGGVDKWMAWLAREHNQFITSRMESLVLSKLPVETMSLPERVTERLHHFDIHTVAQVIALPSGFLESHLGFDHDFVMRRLTRHREPVRPNFPPRKIEAHTDITESDDFACQRSIGKIAQQIVAQLGEVAMQSSNLRIEYKTNTRMHRIDHKLSIGILSENRLARILIDLLPGGIHGSLRSIHIEAHGLLPRQSTQDTLWEKPLANNPAEQLERVQNKLHTRYGSNSLVSGRLAFARQQPRFAQLVYQSRGITLP